MKERRTKCLFQTVYYRTYKNVKFPRPKNAPTSIAWILLECKLLQDKTINESNVCNNKSEMQNTVSLQVRISQQHVRRILTKLSDPQGIENSLCEFHEVGLLIGPWRKKYIFYFSWITLSKASFCILFLQFRWVTHFLILRKVLERLILLYPYRVWRLDSPWKFPLVTFSRKFPFSLLKESRAPLKHEEYVISANEELEE